MLNTPELIEMTTSMGPIEKNEWKNTLAEIRDIDAYLDVIPNMAVEEEKESAVERTRKYHESISALEIADSDIPEYDPYSDEVWLAEKEEEQLEWYRRRAENEDLWSDELEND
jgi:hypothetical protein